MADFARLTRSLGSLCVVVVASCSSDDPVGGSVVPPMDASSRATDASSPGTPDAGSTSDATPGGPSGGDAGVAFATYRLEIGSHVATVIGGTSSNPIAGFSSLKGRDYDFVFNPSAKYILTNPVQPQDQNDWSKLPGFSDCGQLDLAQYGAMFGWRYRLDRNPKVVEVTSYANIAGTHSAKVPPMLELSEAELALEAPLRYRVSIDGASYRFSIAGMLGQRVIDVETTLSRGCASTAPTALKWTSGLYFGGTSTAPSVITANVYERPVP